MADHPHNSGHKKNSDDGADDQFNRFRLELIDDADQTEEQREAAAEDMRFVNVDGGQWENYLTNNIDKDRVKLQFDMVSDFLSDFLGDWSQNRTGVEYKANDKGTTKNDSDLINGIYRSDFRQYSGKLSVDLAVEEAATCGQGAFKLATMFEDEGDPENENQVIEHRPIFNAYNTVHWDASAKRSDKADANHVTTLEQFTKPSFLRKYPGFEPVSAYDPENFDRDLTLRSVDIIYIATRYEVVKKPIKVWVYNNFVTGKIETFSEDDHDLIKDELKADETREFVRVRNITRQVIEKTIFSGDTILEETRRIVGAWLPIIPIYAHRAYVDNVEYSRGFVRKLKDPQRLWNTQLSQLAENAASNGQDVPIFFAQQMENPSIQSQWADKNNAPYLTVLPMYDKEGNVIAQGPIGYSKPGALDQSTQTLMQVVPNFMEKVTGAMMQERLRKDLSGKAMRILIQQENRKTQVVNDHISDSMAWSGTVYQSMAAEVYTSHRIVKTIERDGSESEAQLLGTIIDEETGLSVESNNLQGKKFQSYADAGPQYETQREQTVEEAKGMIEVFGQHPAGEVYIQPLFSIIVDNMVGVGLDPIKEVNHREMLKQGLIKPKSDEDKQFLASLQQQAQQPDAQQDLIVAAAEQQRAEGRSLDAGSVQKTADARKKEAETIKILSEVGTSREKLRVEERRTQQQAAAGLGRVN